MTDAVKPLSSFADFEKLDIRVGRIVARPSGDGGG